MVCISDVQLLLRASYLSRVVPVGVLNRLQPRPKVVITSPWMAKRLKPMPQSQCQAVGFPWVSAMGCNHSCFLVVFHGKTLLTPGVFNHGLVSHPAVFFLHCVSFVFLCGLFGCWFSMVVCLVVSLGFPIQLRGFPFELQPARSFSE